MPASFIYQVQFDAFSCGAVACTPSGHTVRDEPQDVQPDERVLSASWLQGRSLCAPGRPARQPSTSGPRGQQPSASPAVAEGADGGGRTKRTRKAEDYVDDTCAAGAPNSGAGAGVSLEASDGPSGPPPRKRPRTGRRSRGLPFCLKWHLYCNCSTFMHQLCCTLNQAWTKHLGYSFCNAHIADPAIGQEVAQPSSVGVNSQWCPRMPKPQPAAVIYLPVQ